MGQALEKIEGLIKSLQNNELVDNLDVYSTGASKDYLYYYDILGVLKGDFFNLRLMKFRRGKDTKLKIVSTTDCVEAIREIVETRGISLTE